LERQGVRAHGAFITLVGRASGNPTKGRVGFTVSKKVGNAVMRNHVKRRLRDIARRHKDAWSGRDIIIIAKPESAGRTLAELEGDVLATLGKLDVTRTQSKLSRAPPSRGAHGKPPRPDRPR
jgi:ribonuclease P protein component